jgi:hypothetical protein
MEDAKAKESPETNRSEPGIVSITAKKFLVQNDFGNKF